MIIVHCADTPPDMDVTVEMIRGWHKAKGWDDIGYHWLVRRDGSVHAGRDEDLVGAHVQGQNSHSIGICLAGGGGGKFDFTRGQLEALTYLINALLLKYRRARVTGHNEFDAGKTCPNFDVERWWYGNKGSQHT